MDFTAVLVAEDQNPWERIAAEVLASPAYDSTAARVKAFVQRDSKRGQAFLGISRIWEAQDLSCPGVTPPFVNNCTLRSGARSLMQAIESVRSGGKLVGVSCAGLRWKSTSTSCASAACRVLFPNISTLADLEHTVRLVGSGAGG